MARPPQLPYLFANFPSQISHATSLSTFHSAQKSNVSRQPSVRKRARVNFLSPPNSPQPSKPPKTIAAGVNAAITSGAYLMLPRVIKRDVGTLSYAEILKAANALVHSGHWSAVIEVFDLARKSKELYSKFTHRIYTALFYALMKIGEKHHAKRGYREWVEIVEKEQDKLLMSPRSYNFLSVLMSRVGMVDEVIDVRTNCLANGYYMNLYSSNSFVNACTKANRVEDAFETLRQMAETNVSPDVITFNMLISCCVRTGDLEVALGILHRMRDWGISPDVYSYNSIINGLRKYNMLDEAFELVAQMEIAASGNCKITLVTDIPRGNVWTVGSSDGNSSPENDADAAGSEESYVDREKIASVIRMLGSPDTSPYAEKRPTECNQESIEDVPPFVATQLGDSNDNNRKGEEHPDPWPAVIYPDQVTYNTLISGVAAHTTPDFEWAIGVKRHMRARGIVCNEVTYQSLLGCAVRANLLDESFLIYEEMVSYGLKPSREFFISLITLCGRNRNMERAVQVHQDMAASGIDPSVITYNSLLTACRCSGSADAGDKCLNILKTMKEGGCFPDVVTYSTLIDILGRLGRFGDVSGILDEMSKNGIEPNLVTYTSVISALTRAGDLRGAFRVLQDMEKHGIRPNVYTFSSLIHGAGRSNNTEMVSQILDMMESRGVTPSQVTFSTLLQVALRTGKRRFLEEVLNTLERDSRLRGSPQLQKIRQLSQNPDIFSEKMRKKAYDMMNRNLCQCLPAHTERKPAIPS